MNSNTLPGVFVDVLIDFAGLYACWCAVFAPLIGAGY